MSYISIILLAFALAIDAMVVSFSYGLIYNKNKVQNALRLGIITGFFQFLMPIIGYFLTNFVKNYIEPYSKFIVFLIFVYLGFKFIKEAQEKKEKEEKLCIDFKCLILIGIATSIDAFGAGISLCLYKNTILKPALLIGLITFLNAILGFILGGKLKHLPTKHLEIFSGIILILLGFKALC